MDTSTPGSLAWTCPSCTRRVPRKVETCRCGFAQADLPVEPATDVAEPPQAPRSSSPSYLLVAGGVVLGAALVMVPVWSTLKEIDARSKSAAPLAAAIEGDLAPLAPAAEGALAPLAPANEAVLAPIAPAGEAAIAPAREESLEDIVSRVLPAVASISSSHGRGTGFFISADRVLTNAHVVGNQTSVRLQVGQAKYTAIVRTVSTSTDLALLQVDNPSSTQPFLRMGSVSGARAGQEVIAVGSALGVYSNSVTRGIVSAVRRAGNVTLLQTDAAINPGNSGGPLIDRSGVVLGVNSMGYATGVAEGLAFAVAIDHATPLLSGRTGTDAETPRSALIKAIGAERTPGDDLRAQGERSYAQVLEWAARNASEIDTYWQRYADGCVASATRSGDRPWFAVLEPNGIKLTPNAICPNWLTNLQEDARQIQAEVDKAAELARQHGVYPGALRDLRRRYRMEWSGWRN